MAELPFNEDILDSIADNRTGFLTSFFKTFTFLGSEEAYILLVVSIYWLYKKSFGVRIALVILFSALLNHILKISIRNPRPFVAEGTYVDKWAISGETAYETSLEFSTPSGHAQGAASFWSYIYLKVTSKTILILAIILILLIGLSRPYLGVHYFEDIILGWIIGLSFAYVIIKNESSIEKIWSKYSDLTKLTIVVVISIITWIIAGSLSDYGPDGEPFASLGGFLCGLLIGRSLELQYVDFNNEFSSIGIAVARFIVGAILVVVTLFGLDALFSAFTDDDSLLGFLFRFVRYTTVGLVAGYIAPLLFVKLNLAERSGKT
ncbi:MAG: phosphatase PAP2 family protein [Candidatus Kariarchaeaceae archaeon]|jgi:membrane-associated phospholipid phosphatase